MSDQNPTPAPEGRDQGHPQEQHQVPQYGQQPAYDPQQYPPEQQYGQYPPQQYAPQGQAQQYGQPPYQQPGYDPHQPGYDPQQYGQYPQQYGQYAPHGYQQQWPEQQPQSQTLGVIGLGIVAVCAVVLAVVSYLVGGHMGQFMVDYGIEALETVDPNDPLIIGLSQQVQGLTTAGAMAVFGGIAGWIVSIVATSSRRGRRYGVWGIVLGILAPGIAFIAMLMGLWPAVSVLVG